MIPGLKVVAPSTPRDVKGLLAAAIRDPDPVVFFEHKALYATKGEVPDGEHVDTLGTANPSPGTDLTIPALALMVPRALEAAERLQSEHGIFATWSMSARWCRSTLRRFWRGLEDRSAVHGRGKSAAVRLGRRDRSIVADEELSGISTAADTASPPRTFRCRPPTARRPYHRRASRESSS